MESLNIQIGYKSAWQLPLENSIASVRAPQDHVSCVADSLDAALTNPLDFQSLDQA